MLCEVELGTCETMSKIPAKQPTLLLAPRTRQHEPVPTLGPLQRLSLRGSISHMPPVSRNDLAHSTECRGVNLGEGVTGEAQEADRKLRNWGWQVGAAGGSSGRRRAGRALTRTTSEDWELKTSWVQVWPGSGERSPLRCSFRPTVWCPMQLSSCVTSPDCRLSK